MGVLSEKSGLATGRRLSHTRTRGTYKILVIRLGSLGDVLLTTPVLRELRRLFPHAELHYVTRRRYRELLVNSPCVDTLHLVPNNPGVVSLLGAGMKLRPVRFDLVVDLHSSLRSALLRSALGALSEMHYQPSRKRRLVAAHDGASGGAWASLTERFLETLSPLGVQAYPQRLELYWGEAAEQRAAALTRGMDYPLVAVAPGARWPTKRWLPERFAAVGDTLAREYRATVILVGDGSDKPICDQVASLMEETPRVVVGSTSVLETAAILVKCRLLVCNDSGLLHVARAVGTAVVAIFGPTGPELGYYPWEPYARALSLQMPCSPCTSKGSRRCPKHHFRCMRDLPVETVVEAARELWNLG